MTLDLQVQTIRPPRNASELGAFPKADVSLLTIPYPYRASLAICSDLDETPNAAVYAEIMRFLNTTEHTVMGPGVGLEIGNTIYFDMPPEQFSYWGTDDAGRSLVRDFIHSGHVDCLHSFGDLATTRAHAERALNELDRHNCRIDTWVDHAIAPTNFGADIMRGRGDLAGDPAYHADLTIDYGVKFVWRGRVTSVIGQNRPRSLRGIFDRAHAIASMRTTAKEFAKSIAGVLGQQKYAMHCTNRLYRQTTLRDGRPVYEFMRFDPYRGGVGKAATAAGVADIITPRLLEEFVARGGLGVFYTHLGKVRDSLKPFDQPTIAAFRLLANYAASQKILVTTTSRLLRYATMRDRLQWSAREVANKVIITLERVLDAVTGPRVPDLSELGGLSFHCKQPGQIIIQDSSGRLLDIKCTDVRDGRIAQIPMTELQFPSIDRRHFLRDVEQPAGRKHTKEYAVARIPTRDGWFRPSQFNRKLARSLCRIGMWTYEIILSLTSLRGRARTQRPRKRILLTGLFLSDRWMLAHVRPMAMSEAVERVYVVGHRKMAPIENVVYLYPPTWMQKSLGQAAARSLCFIWHAIRLNPDIVGGFHLLCNGLLAILTARLTRAQSLYFCVGGWSELLGGGAHSDNRLFGTMVEDDAKVERRLLNAVRKMDLIATMGTRAKDFFHQRSVSAEVNVMPGGMDPAEFQKRSVAPTYDVIGVYRLVPVKRPDIFLKAIAIAHRTRPSLRAAIVGTGSLYDDLITLRKDLGLDDVVDFLGHRDDVPALLADARIFLLTSDSEGVALSVMEALTAGCPVVVSDVGDLADVVDDGVNGYLIERGDVQGFANRLISLLENQPLFDRLAQAAVNTAQSFSLAATVQKWNDILAMPQNAHTLAPGQARPMHKKQQPVSTQTKRDLVTADTD